MLHSLWRGVTLDVSSFSAGLVHIGLHQYFTAPVIWSAEHFGAVT